MSRLDKPLYDKELVKNILFKTNNGIDIISRYTHLKKYGRKLKGLCPYHSERTPSCIVSPDTGHFICYGCGKTGNAIDLIMDKVGLDFQGALSYIVEDFHLNICEPIVLPEPVRREPILCIIDFVDKPFTRQHHKYFNAYHLEEPFLKTLGIYAIDKWAINGKLQKMEFNQYSFAYLDEVTEYVKVLSLNVSKDLKWRNSAPRSHLWQFPEQPVEQLFIEKSNKDNALNILLGYNGTAVNSENAENLIENMPRILEVCPKPMVSFGSDPTDDAKVDKVIKEYPIAGKFSIPRQLLKFQINDKAEVSKAFGLTYLDKLIKEQL